LGPAWPGPWLEAELHTSLFVILSWHHKLGLSIVPVASGKSNISLFNLITTYFAYSQNLSSFKETSVKENSLRISSLLLK
jgi:hypothetical protein